MVCSIWPSQQRWQRLDGAVLLPLVHAGVKFVDGDQKQTLTTTHASHLLFALYTANQRLCRGKFEHHLRTS